MIVEAVNPGHQPAPVLQKRFRHYPPSLPTSLCLCLLTALLIRALLIIHTNGFIDGDEALVGIQAQHILQGKLAIYFYGVPYFGSLEAYLVALIFAIAGSSVWSLRAEPTLLSLIIVWLTWKLAAALADVAQLPHYGRQHFITIAALLAAVSPLYDTVLELRTFGGYIETVVLMLVLLLSALQLTQRWRAGASKREIIQLWAAIGFIIGLGLWIDPLIISAIVAAALWIIGYCLAEIISLRRQFSESFWQAVLPLLKNLLWAAVIIPMGIIGCAPAIYWGAKHNWQNITYILQLANNTPMNNPYYRWLYPTRLALTGGLTKLYATCVAPHVISGALPLENGAPLTAIHVFTLILGVACLLVTLVLIILSSQSHHPLLLQAQRLAALPLLFGLTTAFFFCINTASAAGLDCDRDLSGRYATPLVLALPFVFATVFTIISIYLHQHTGKQAQSTGDTLTVPGSILSRLHYSMLAQAALFAILLAYLCAQVTTYALTDAGYTFQSPYCTRAPADNDTIIAYLQHEHIRYIWAPNWVGYPIVFKTNGAISLADPQPLIKNLKYFNRLPADVTAVLHADRPSFLVMVPHGDRHSQLLKMFDAQHITYRAVYFPSQPGTDILLATPLNHSVSPLSSSAYFNIFHCSI